MTSECSFNIGAGQDILQLHGILKRHVTVYPPPYSIVSIMSPFMVQHGRPIQVVIHHASRDVQIVESSISNHVLQTTVRAFQTHRLSNYSAPRRRLPQPQMTFHSASRNIGAATEQDCPICFDSIRQNEGFALPCMHVFHPRCIRPWLMENDSCPVCRRNVSDTSPT